MKEPNIIVRLILCLISPIKWRERLVLGKCFVILYRESRNDSLAFELKDRINELWEKEYEKWWKFKAKYF